MWPRLVVAALGAWLMASPAVFGYDGAAATSDHIAGPLVVTFAIIAASKVTRSLRRLNTVIGTWIAVAPFILGHTGAAAVNSVIAGLAIAALSLVGRDYADEYGGGWSSLWD